MLTVRRLTVRARPAEGRARLLEPVDLDIAAGACVVLGGPSGSGKTVLLRAIVDLDPNEGEVVLDGIGRGEVPAPEWCRRVAYVPAESGWWPDRVADHFADAAPDHLLTRFGLSAGMLDAPVSRLSTGERQRLALVHALLPGPRVLLLDEPTSGLDPAAARVEAELHRRLAGGTAILMVTHDDRQAARFGGTRLLLENGVLRSSEDAACGRRKTRQRPAPARMHHELRATRPLRRAARRFPGGGQRRPLLRPRARPGAASPGGGDAHGRSARSRRPGAEGTVPARVPRGSPCSPRSSWWPSPDARRWRVRPDGSRDPGRTVSAPRR